jgi:hypothetical protein
VRNILEAKILDSCLEKRVVEPTPPVFESFSTLYRPKHTLSPVAPVMHNPQGGNRSIILRDVYGFFALRPRDVQHPTSKVYHVRCQTVLARAFNRAPIYARKTGVQTCIGVAARFAQA